MGNDKEIDANARIKAHNTAGEIAMMIYKVYSEAVVSTLKDRADRFSHDRETAWTRFMAHTPVAHRRHNPIPYSAEAYEQAEEDQQRQQFELEEQEQQHEE